MAESCNKDNCTCPNTKCENHGKCCACVNHHRSLGSLPYCMRDIANKK